MTVMTDPDFGVVRDEPPQASNAPNGLLDANLVEASEHPGEWLRIITYPTSPGDDINACRGRAGVAAADLRRGKRGKGRPDGQWEFRSGMLDDRTGAGVWARYVGPDEGATA